MRFCLSLKHGSRSIGIIRPAAYSATGPNDYLNQYDIEARHPDIFIRNLIDLDESKALDAFKNQVERLQNPVRTEKQVLDILVSYKLNLGQKWQNIKL
jgi:hypothetical protein